MKQNQTEQNRKKFSGGILRILVLILIATLVVLLLSRSLYSGYSIPRYSGNLGYAEDSWVLRQGETILDPELKLPAFLNLETGVSYSISAPLTYDGSKDDVPSCFFFVDHMHCRVYLDGEVLFSYTPEDVIRTDKARSPGNVYVSFLLPKDCQGKVLTVEFIPALNSGIEYQLPNPTCGDYSTTAVSTFWNDLPHNLVVLVAGFLGIAALLFSTLALSGSQYREGLFIGIFATLFSLYNITESDFDFYILSNPYYTYLLDYTTFTLMPIFLMAFIRERLDTKRKPIALVVILFGFIMYIVEVALHFSGILDMREFLPVLHIFYFCAFLTIFVLMLTSKETKWRTQLVIQMVPILFGMLIDVAVYYLHWQLDSSDATFTSVGVLLFLISEIYHVWRYSVDVYLESKRSKDYREMAYVDALTGIGNRRAFDMEMTAIADGKKTYITMVVASVDVNDLKYNNDTYGHAAGDFLIRSAAEVLFELSENYGSVFRMGGDEFLVFLYDIEPEKFQTRLERMTKQIEAINSNSEIKLSLALGYEVSYGDDLDAVIDSADKKMYEDKDIYRKNRTLG